MSDNSLILLAAEADRYLAEADALKYDDPSKILAAAQAAAFHAQKLGDFRRYARALVHQAWAYGFLNQYELSLSHALEVLVLARDYHLVDIEALTVGVIAFNFLKCGMLEETIHLFEHQRILGEQLLDNAIQAMALNDMAVVKMETGDYVTSAELLHQAVRLMPSDTHDGMDKSLTHLNLALACVKTGQFDDAIEHAQQVLRRVKKYPRTIADAHLWIAASYLEQGELDAARQQVALARACVEKASVYSDNVEQMTAELLTAEGRHEEAAQVWEYIYRMAVERQELDYAINALHSLKTAYERLHDTAGVISAYKRLAEDIPAQQKQSSDLRFRVLRMVFAKDRAALEAELRLNRQKSAILSRLSHEFRTPLTIINSSTELLERYADKLTLEERQERLQRITTQVKWMTVMLDDILDVLRLDEQDTALFNPTRFQLNDLAQAALSQLNRYQLSNLQIRVDVQPATIQSAPQALQAILVHLLTNAIKFSQKEVSLDLEVQDSTLVMEVVDEGIGIPMAEQQEVFKPLIRGSNLDEVKGNGLGLAIVAKLVRQMRGKIDLESRVGKGTRVSVHIPVVIS